MSLEPGCANKRGAQQTNVGPSNSGAGLHREGSKRHPDVASTRGNRTKHRQVHPPAWLSWPPPWRQPLRPRQLRPPPPPSSSPPWPASGAPSSAASARVERSEAAERWVLCSALWTSQPPASAGASCPSQGFPLAMQCRLQAAHARLPPSPPPAVSSPPHAPSPPPAHGGKKCRAYEMRHSAAGRMQVPRHHELGHPPHAPIACQFAVMRPLRQAVYAPSAPCLLQVHGKTGACRASHQCLGGRLCLLLCVFSIIHSSGLALAGARGPLLQRQGKAVVGKAQGISDCFEAGSHQHVPGFSALPSPLLPQHFMWFAPPSMPPQVLPPLSSSVAI